MGIGLKRICQSCAAKFYDLEKNPITCPKCGSVFDPEAVNKPKRGRRKAAAIEENEAEIEISLDDEAIEELDEDAAVDELDEEIRDEMEIDDEDGNTHIKGDKKVLVDLDDDTDDIIEADDVSDKE